MFFLPCNVTFDRLHWLSAIRVTIGIWRLASSAVGYSRNDWHLAIGFIGYRLFA
jgi:hypothetical protein